MSEIFTITRDGNKATPIATEMPCGHIFWGNPPEDCPVCAKIRSARENNHQETLECLEMARKEGRKEVLELCIDTLKYGEECHDSLIYAIRQDYRERYGE